MTILPSSHSCSAERSQHSRQLFADDKLYFVCSDCHNKWREFLDFASSRVFRSLFIGSHMTWDQWNSYQALFNRELTVNDKDLDRVAATMIRQNNEENYTKLHGFLPLPNKTRANCNSFRIVCSNESWNTTLDAQFK